MSKSNTWGNGFDQGYACACANMLRDHDEPTMVEDCLAANLVDLVYDL